MILAVVERPAYTANKFDIVGRHKLGREVDFAVRKLDTRLTNSKPWFVA